jgi:hypothetical protein
MNDAVTGQVDLGRSSMSGNACLLGFGYGCMERHCILSIYSL